MGKIKDGQKLYITAHYAFNYDESPFSHLSTFDIIVQFFEKRNNLCGYVSSEEGDYVEEYSEVSILMDEVYQAFEDRDIPGLVERYLLKYEMYEILHDYNAPLEKEAIEFKNALIQ